MPFQQTMQMDFAPGQAGDFASTNPRHSVLPVAGGFQAGPAGVTIGLFVWADANKKFLANTGSGVPIGFMHRNNQAIITTYLTEFGYLIPAGFGIGELFDSGDFWVKNFGSSAAVLGQKVFANTTNGTITTAAAGATVSGSVETAWFVHTPCNAGELFKMSKQVPD